MRNQTFLKDQCYFISNYGVSQNSLFADDADKARFVFLITHLQSPTRVHNISWYGRRFLKKGSFIPSQPKINEILNERSVEVLAFSVLDNSFFILVKNLEEAVVSVFMQRVLTSYSKYYNSKYERKGHVFSGPFEAVEVKGNYIYESSASIHLSCSDIEDNIEKYPWSSLQDYVGTNRWGDLLVTDQILKHFKNQADYKKFVLDSKKQVDKKVIFSPTG